MFLFPSSCRARQRREGSWDNGGGSGVGDCVCVRVCFILCVAGMSAEICVYPERFIEKREMSAGSE